MISQAFYYMLIMTTAKSAYPRSHNKFSKYFCFKVIYLLFCRKIVFCFKQKYTLMYFCQYHVCYIFNLDIYSMYSSCTSFSVVLFNKICNLYHIYIYICYIMFIYIFINKHFLSLSTFTQNSCLTVYR